MAHVLEPVDFGFQMGAPLRALLILFSALQPVNFGRSPQFHIEFSGISPYAKDADEFVRHGCRG
jgi:hypothetical protein